MKLSPSRCIATRVKLPGGLALRQKEYCPFSQFAGTGGTTNARES